MACDNLSMTMLEIWFFIIWRLCSPSWRLFEDMFDTSFQSFFGFFFFFFFGGGGGVKLENNTW